MKTIDSFSIEHEQDYQSLEEFAFNKASAEATIFARNLANTRGSEATPCWMEARVSELLAAKASDAVKDVRIIRGQELVDLNMNLFHSVGKAAVSEPRAILVHYKGNAESDEIDLALVGKGVTFDTGGLNLKPTGFMETMYGDKNGACAVLGALHGTLDL